MTTTGSGQRQKAVQITQRDSARNSVSLADAMRYEIARELTEDLLSDVGTVMQGTEKLSPPDTAPGKISRGVSP